MCKISFILTFLIYFILNKATYFDDAFLAGRMTTVECDGIHQNTSAGTAGPGIR
jgi:hypothetical protein